MTDHGLTRLRRLGELRVLGLNHTAVTADGIAELQRALPNCRVFQ